MSSTIKNAAEAEVESVMGVLTLAFGSDPMARWAQPDPQLYLTHFPTLAMAMAGKAFSNGTAYYADGYSGAAIWLKPGDHADEESMIELVERTAPDEIKADLFGVFEEMGKFHPTEPHWYLPLIGVDPVRQGNGTGSALMKHARAACDRDGDRVPRIFQSAKYPAL